MNELLEEKMKIVLNLIRTNNTADDALKIAQAVNYLCRARESLSGELETGAKTTKRSGASAS